MTYSFSLKLIESLGAKAVDYNSPHAKKTVRLFVGSLLKRVYFSIKILSEGPFDVILGLNLTIC